MEALDSNARGLHVYCRFHRAGFRSQGSEAPGDSVHLHAGSELKGFGLFLYIWDPGGSVSPKPSALSPQLPLLRKGPQKGVEIRILQVLVEGIHKQSIVFPAEALEPIWGTCIKL